MCMYVYSTNDVGALKMAHVGVSIVNDPDFETKVSTHVFIYAYLLKTL